jgi:SAM-dependent methyltransferase
MASMIDEKYLAGKAIYGDNFTLAEIRQWYEEESEAYADLGSKEAGEYVYGYHALNQLHGFKYLPPGRFENVLGLGAAWGHEFFPIIDRIGHLHIVEPSDNLQSEKLGNLVPVYKKPAVSGELPYEDNFFDLVTCSGTIHHTPNVSFILSELHRVLKPGGYLLLREPIISMGDWTKPRKGLTKNERGVPLKIFRKLFSDLNLEIVHEGFCFCMTAFFQRIWGNFAKRPIFTYKSYVWLDKYLSKLFLWNLHYHATGKLQRIAPQSVFYVLKKK